MTILEDPNADARSLMMKAPCVCNGEANGVQCKHYWAIVQKFRAANSDAVRSGEKQRACKQVDGFMLEYTSEEKPTYCNSYVPREAPGLVNIVKRAAAKLTGKAPQIGRMPNANTDPVKWGYVAFDSEYEAYKPMTPEEIEKLREAFPDKPVQYHHGKNPMSMTLDDIVNGPQIGILPAGSKPVGSGTLAPEVDEALDGMFRDKSDGILTKK